MHFHNNDNNAIIKYIDELLNNKSSIIAVYKNNQLILTGKIDVDEVDLTSEETFFQSIICPKYVSLYMLLREKSHNYRCIIRTYDNKLLREFEFKRTIK